ncbi:hypothetical protein EOE67_08130 [Rheinheimera riviphila]|uniref:Twin-arginine translocation pathway signal protein n=1 Tax=Rheinheimera riviphila TaxID=1834037 RepID=A0A437QZB8_9GAMM|nr:hypothetical protein [Rheinheimera riviphila]RVU39875.1 hypothetical protein EOE67_08130 [Rheinheimera riviphila]
MQRRQFIMLGLAAGATLATGVSLYPLAVADQQERRDAAALVLDAILPALLLGALPQDPKQQQLALLQTRNAALDFLPFLPKRTQAELAQLFLLLSEQVTRLALTGHLIALDQLSIQQRLQLLESWRISYLALLQQAFNGLRALLLGAYYGHPAQWPALSYQAPEFRAYE